MYSLDGIHSTVYSWGGANCQADSPLRQTPDLESECYAKQFPNKLRVNLLEISTDHLFTMGGRACQSSVTYSRTTEIDDRNYLVVAGCNCCAPDCNGFGTCPEHPDHLFY